MDISKNVERVLPIERASAPARRACPLCGGSGGRVVSRDSNRRDGLSVWGEYVRCAGCGHLYLWPVPDSGELAGFYEQLWRDETSTKAKTAKDKKTQASAAVKLASDLFTKVEYKLFKKSFEQHTSLHQFLPPVSKEQPRMLDMGCGEGVGLTGFVGRGWKLYGIDISATAVESARQRIPSGEFVCGELTEAARSFGPFDLVRLDNVLEHVIDPVFVLRSAYEHLAPGGHLAVYVPHGDSLSLRWFRTRSVSHWVPFHLHLFTEQSLRRAIERVGFEMKETLYIDPPSWWTLTMTQALHPKYNLAKYGGAATGSIHLRLAAMPFRALSRIGKGEELIAFAQKV